MGQPAGHSPAGRRTRVDHHPGGHLGPPGCRSGGTWRCALPGNARPGPGALWGARPLSGEVARGWSPLDWYLLRPLLLPTRPLLLTVRAAPAVPSRLGVAPTGERSGSAAVTVGGRGGGRAEGVL